MEKKEFSRLESLCQLRFVEAGRCFHVCSQENHSVLFHNVDEFRSAMNIVAFTAMVFPDLKIYTFEVMDNHFHFALSGNEERINSFINTLVLRLSLLPSLQVSKGDIKSLDFKRLKIESLDNLRNVIAYINRNGAMVYPYENVFTYRWGANRYFFNREAGLRYEECGRKATCREKREMFHSAQLDSRADVIVLDGYVPPLCYCHISEAESFFRNSRHYFQCVSRNIESAKDIAKIIGEKIFYTDEDLYTHISSLCHKRYDCNSISVLTSESKIEIARELHYDFNAGNKQISRLLKMDISVLNSLFPI